MEDTRQSNQNAKQAALKQKEEQDNHFVESDELLLERAAHVECVVRMISESIEKLKISLIMPHMFENPIMLEEHLRDSKYTYVTQMMTLYKRLKKMPHTKNSHMHSPHLDYHLAKLIDYLHEHYRIADYFPQWLDDLSDTDKSYIEAFKLLKNIAEENLNKSAINKLKKEKKAHVVFHENEALRQSITQLEQRLKSQRISIHWKLSARDAIIKKYEEDMLFYRYDNSIKIQQEILLSGRNLRLINTASLNRQKELQAELERTKTIYDNMLKENLKREKIAKEEKNKLLLQLQSLIKKYNQTIGEKLEESEALQKEFEHQKELFELFMVDFNLEEEEYNRIVRVKEEEEREKQQRKIMLFMMNRAARIIQRRWRRYRRAQKKARGKKGKKSGKK